MAVTAWINNIIFVDDKAERKKTQRGNVEFGFSVDSSCLPQLFVFIMLFVMDHAGCLLAVSLDVKFNNVRAVCACV